MFSIAAFSLYFVAIVCIAALVYVVSYMNRAMSIELPDDEAEEEVDLSDTPSYYHPAVQDEIHQDDFIPEHVRKFLDEKHSKK